MVISEKYTDMAGKYRVIVKNDTNTRAYQLRFDSTVSDAVALAKAQSIADAEAEQQEIDSWTTIELSL